MNPGSKAYAVQQVWRELDICIIQTIDDSTLEVEDKNRIILDKIVEMERYIELKEDGVFNLLSV